jgi:hypothetical protein
MGPWTNWNEPFGAFGGSYKLGKVAEQSGGSFSMDKTVE